MRRDDYVCQNPECGLVFEYWKKDLDNFPEIVECERCGANAIRKYSGLVFDVARGKLGNEENAYTTGCVNHCSEYGKYRGVRVK